ncbi:MAG: nucleoside recognition domain-containing protein [Bacteroidia bacterium]
MVLHWVWLGFFVIAFVVALYKLIFLQDTTVFGLMTTKGFEASKSAFEIALGLTGMITLWSGLMNIGEKGGAVGFLSRITSPFFSRLFPEIPKGHPAMGSVLMNFAANMLGLNNAATPLGLKAMEQMQELNPEKEKASNAQIMFLVINTSSLTLIPTTIIALRQQNGALNPSDIFLPTLIATTISTLTGIILLMFRQQLWRDGRLWMMLAGIAAVVLLPINYLLRFDQKTIQTVSDVVGSGIIFSIIIAFLLAGAFRKQNVFDNFIEGAKEGFQTAVRIIPYLVAMLVGIAVFRASGTMDMMLNGAYWVVAQLGIDGRFVPALPVAMMKPLSGSGSQALIVDLLKQGADTLPARIACIMQGAADTTFYIAAVYFGSVGVRKTRYAIGYGLLADLAGIVAAIVVGYLFFG